MIACVVCLGPPFGPVDLKVVDSEWVRKRKLRLCKPLRCP